MKSKNEFYKAFFEALNKLGYDIKKSTSADYYADIYKNGQIVAFYLPNDTIEKNPFIIVTDQIMDEINDLARRTALRCGICTEKPYTEQNQKLPGGASLLSQFNDVVLACSTMCSALTAYHRKTVNPCRCSIITTRRRLWKNMPCVPA